MAFRAQGEICEGSLDIDPKAPKIWLHNEDDMYVNMALLEVLLEKGLIEPKWDNHMQSTAVWVTGLDDGKHTLKVVISHKKNPGSSGTSVGLGRVVSYRGTVAALPD